MSPTRTNSEDSAVAVKSVPRLCSEIQLFDLCAKEACADKDGRFCGNPTLVARFEEIAEDAGPRVSNEGISGEDDEEVDEDGFGTLVQDGDDDSGEDWEEE